MSDLCTCGGSKERCATAGTRDWRAEQREEDRRVQWAREAEWCELIARIGKPKDMPTETVSCA